MCEVILVAQVAASHERNHPLAGFDPERRARCSRLWGGCPAGVGHLGDARCESHAVGFHPARLRLYPAGQEPPSARTRFQLGPWVGGTGTRGAPPQTHLREGHFPHLGVRSPGRRPLGLAGLQRHHPQQQDGGWQEPPAGGPRSGTIALVGLERCGQGGQCEAPQLYSPGRSFFLTVTRSKR